MAIYKRGDTYWYEFVFNGTQYRQSTNVGDQRTARQIEAARASPVGGDSAREVT